MLLLLGGCTGSAPCPEDSCSDDAEPGAGNPLFDVQVPTTLERPLEEVLALLEDRLALGLPTPLRVREVYRDLMNQREWDTVLDLPCPTFEDQTSDTWIGVWQSDCDTTTGYHFYGVANYFEIGESDESDETTALFELAMLSSFEISDPEGLTLIGGGTMGLEREHAAGTVTLVANIGGTYRYPGASGWIGAGADTSLTVAAEVVDGQGTLTLSGGVGYEGLDVDFRATEFPVGGCDMLPGGLVRVRDPSGYWLEMTFADCDPCAVTVFNDVEQGSACIGDALAAAALGMWDEFSLTTGED